MPLDDPKGGAPEDRQRFVRQSLLVAARLLVAEEDFEADILDLSAGGAKITCDQALAPETPVTLVVRGVGDFRGHVAWSDGRSHGLRFAIDPDIVEAAIPRILEASDSRERRRHTRSSVLWKAEIFGGIRRAECEVLNISKSGVRVRVKTDFKAEGEVTLRSIRFGEHKGRMVWREKDRLGIEFIGNEDG